jgi:hypothetical protein
MAAYPVHTLCIPRHQVNAEVFPSDSTPVAASDDARLTANSQSAQAQWLREDVEKCDSEPTESYTRLISVLEKHSIKDSHPQPAQKYSSAPSASQSLPHCSTLDTTFSANVTTSSIATSQPTTKESRVHILDLPPELLEMICKKHLDLCSNTCLGLTCKTFFNITEDLAPFQVNLHARTPISTTLPRRWCLGHLLTSWMEPKYSFDHSWGKFLLKKHYLMDEAAIERKWREKESWPKIRLTPIDKMGASVAYRASIKRTGF